MWCCGSGSRFDIEQEVKSEVSACAEEKGGWEVSRKRRERKEGGATQLVSEQRWALYAEGD